MNATFPEIMTALGDLVLPRRCIVCGTLLALREKHLCIRCLSDLPRTFFPDQSRNQMADRFNALIQRDRESDATLPREEYAFAASLFFYRSSAGYSKIPQRLKYHADFAAGRFFSGILGERMASSPLFRDVDMVIPVPLHRARRWSRGFNQAEVIARSLAAALGAELRTGILYRSVRTRTQTRLSLEEKARNVASAFRVRKHIQKHTAPPRHILLVDDVFTTGATLHACFRALREVFPPSVRISVATLACVGR